jgi:hypothetical protein
VWYGAGVGREREETGSVVRSKFGVQGTYPKSLHYFNNEIGADESSLINHQTHHTFLQRKWFFLLKNNTELCGGAHQIPGIYSICFGPKDDKQG